MSEEKESQFLLEELFFSRTDLKGHIESGNSVFQRVSGFSWDELLKRPHNIIRHPHMPKGVFHFFWKELKDERPVGAYVKNQSKDKGVYWVYALALPVTNGYVSVRLKPSTEVLHVVSGLYLELRSQERTLTPEQSQEILLGKISELGFSSYRDFMTESLIGELDSRYQKLHGSHLHELKVLKDLNSINKKLCKIPGEILSAYRTITWTPLNLEISALKLGDIGRSVGVIAATYQKMISEIERQILEFEKVSINVEHEIKDSTFLMSAAYLLNEVIDFFYKEPQNQFIDNNVELDYLMHLRQSYLEKTNSTLNKVHQTLLNFSSICKGLNSLIIGLEVIRVSGRIEISRLTSSHEFNNLLQELVNFQKLVNKNLNELQALTDKASAAIKELL